MKLTKTNFGLLMAAIVAVSIGSTYAITQGLSDGNFQPSGALMTGNVKVTHYDGEGNIIGYRQSANHIVDTGMNMIITNMFADINGSIAGPEWDNIPAGASSKVRYMEIGTGGENNLLHNNTDIAVTIPGCARQDAAFTNVSAHRSPDSTGGVDDCFVVQPDGSTCRSRINVTAMATFQGMSCSGALDIDEAGMFNDPTSGVGEMFARNTFGGVVLNPPDQLALDWEFTFTDS